MTAQPLIWSPDMPGAIVADMPTDWWIPPTWIPGQPRPQGSKKAFWREGMKHAGMTESSPHIGAWRSDVRTEVAKVHPGVPLVGALEVAVVFVFARPLGHHIAGNRSRPLRPDAPVFCTSRQAGDLDKLLRGIGDALTGVAWEDDDLIVRWHDPVKLWGPHAGAWLTYRPIPEARA